MIFFYEFLFVLVAVIAVLIGEIWSRTAAVIFVGLWFAVSVVGYASFGARLTVSGASIGVASPTTASSNRLIGWIRDMRTLREAIVSAA